MPEPKLLTSPVLTHVPHAFSTRVGGVSPQPFDSLNFGNPGDLPPSVARDPVARIAENFRLVLGASGVPNRRIVQVHQVHGLAVEVARLTADRWPAPGHNDPKADAIVTDDPDCMIAVRVADCCPVLLSSGDGRVVSAVHAGWRGTVAGVLSRAVETMRAIGATELRAAIGPCISARNFEVGPEVEADFASTFGKGRYIQPSTDPARAAAGKFHADIPGALHHQLLEAGVSKIDVIGLCTYERADLFFSHRRDRGVTGRMIGLIGPRG